MNKSFLRKMAVAAVCALPILSGCSKYDDTDLRNEVEKQAERIAALETWQTQVNSDIQSLKTLVNALNVGDMITGVTPFTTPPPGGYTVTFIESAPITIHNGDKGDAPQIGVAEFPAESGTYYWTLDGSFIEDGGEKIRVAGPKGDPGPNPLFRIDATGKWEVSYDNGASYTTTGVTATGPQGETPKLRINTGNWEVSYDNSQTWTSLGVKATGDTGVTPQLQINEDSNEWEVSYDNGQTWTSLGVTATGADGKDGNDGISEGAIFSDLDNTHDDYVVFILTGGGTLEVPRYRGMDITFTQPENFAPAQSKDIPYTTTGPVTGIKVVGITPPDWKVSVNSTESKFTVTAPNTFNGTNVYGEAVVLVSDGGERTVMRTLEFSTTVVLNLDTEPTQMNYGIGEPLNMAGMVVTAAFGGNPAQPISIDASNLSYDFSNVNNTLVTVSAFGHSVEFNVNVYNLATRIANASGTTATVIMYASEDISKVVIDYNTDITLRPANNGGTRIIGLSAEGRAFSVGTSSTLRLSSGIYIDGSNIDINSAPLVYVNGGTFIMNAGSRLQNNNNGAGNGQGGGLYVGQNSSCTINGAIMNNNANYGGGIYQSGNVLISSSASITGNSAVSGGGVYISGGTLTLRSAITGNSASMFGGGAYVAAPSGTLNATATSSIKGNLITQGAAGVGRDVFLDSYGTNDRGVLSIGNDTQIGNLCLYASGYGGFSRITLAAGTYSGTDNLITELDLYGEEATATAVRTAWLDQTVVEGPITLPILSRIKLNRAYSQNRMESVTIPTSLARVYYGINTSGLFKRYTIARP